MMLSRWIVLGLMASAGAAHTAVWDDHKQLVCRAVADQYCSIRDGSCKNAGVNAVWKLDFTANTVTYLGGEIQERIIGRNVEIVQGDKISEAIFLSSNRVMKFYKPDAATQENPVPSSFITANVAGGGDKDQAVGILFECGSL